ncbi:MAG TPA: hypothetical protein VIF57_15920 [Polyangia bacterium]
MSGRGGLRALIVLAALAAGCSKEKESLILVSLTSSDAQANQVRDVTLSSEGVVKTYHPPDGLSTTPHTFGMYVPSDVSGSVDVSVIAVSPSDCSIGYVGTTRTMSFKVGDTTQVTITLKRANLCSMGGSGGSTGGTTGSGGTGGSGTGGSATGGSGTGGSATGGSGTGGNGTGGSGTGGSGTGTAGQGGSSSCAGPAPPAGTPPSLTCCTEYDHTLLGTACDDNDTYIYNLAFAPDGTRLVTGGDDGRYVFWIFDGKTLTPEVHYITGGVYGYLGISPDSATLVAGGNDVHLFGIPTSTTAPLTDVGSLPIDYTSYGVAWAPDGQRVIDIDDTYLYVHAVTSMLQIGKAALIHTPWAMAVSPVAVGGGIGVVMPSTSGYATIYSVSGTTTAATIGPPLDVNVSPTELWSAAFSANGTQLAIGGYDSFVNIWNYPLANASATPALRFSIDEPMELEDVQGIAFSPNGRYLAVATGYYNQGHASIWDLTTQTLVGRVALPTRYALSVAFSPSGNAIAVGEHGCGKFLLCATQ